MKRDKTHIDQVKRWAKYCKENPKKWKAKVKPIIDGQFVMARRFYKNLMKTQKGKEKLMLIRKIKV